MCLLLNLTIITKFDFVDLYYLSIISQITKIVFFFVVSRFEYFVQFFTSLVECQGVIRLVFIHLLHLSSIIELKLHHITSFFSHLYHLLGTYSICLGDVVAILSQL